MANEIKTLRTRIAQKFATVAEWEAAKDNNNEVYLLKGELAFDETGKYKINTGPVGPDSVWSKLPYAASYAFVGTDATITNGVPNLSPNDYQSGTIVIVTSEDKERFFIVVETESVVNNVTTYTKTWKEINSTNQEVVAALIDEQIQSVVGNLEDLENSGIALPSEVTNPTVTDYLAALQDEIEAQENDLVSAIATNAGEIAELKTVVDNDSTDAPGLVQQVASINDEIDVINDNIEYINDKIGDTTLSSYTNIGSDIGAGNQLVQKIIAIDHIASDASQKVEDLFTQDGKINPTILPSFVDDVVEGVVVSDITKFVVPGETDSADIIQNLYNITHNAAGAVTGVFVPVSATGAKTTRVSETVTKYALFSVANIDGELPSSLQYKVDENTWETIELWPLSMAPVTGTNAHPQNPIEPETDAIYVDIVTNSTYRWGGQQYVLIASDLAIGTTTGTAFEGSRGVRLETAVATLVSEVDTLETNVNTELADANARIEANTIAIASLRSDINSDNTEITEKLAEIENTLGNIGQTGIQDDNVQITTVAGQLVELNGELQDVKLRANNNKDEIDALTSSMTDLTARVEANENNISSLNAAVVSLQSKDVDLEGSINALAASMESSVADVSAIETSISSIESEISALDGKIGELPDGVTSVQDEIDEIKETLEQQSDLEPRVAELETTTNAHSIAIADLISQHEQDVEDIAVAIAAVKEDTTKSVDMKSVIENSEEIEDGGTSYIDLGTNELVLNCGGATNG